MVRKSNKANAAEKPARKRRGTRRRKESSSESEPDSSTAPREENVSAIALPVEPKKEETEEVESTSTNRGRNRRVSKRNATKDETSQDASAAPEVKSEWNEDETFWTGTAPTNAESTEVVNEDEGSTWKIQSSNGSGGEIQKLKICRQRPTDSTGSSSPAKECASPRVKRMAVPEKLDGESAEVVLDVPMDIVDVESEKVVTEKIDLPNVETVTEMEAVPPIPESTPAEKEIKEVQEEIIIPGLDLVGEGQQQNQDQLWLKTSDPITEVSMIAMPPSKEETDTAQIKEIDNTEDVSTNVIIEEPPGITEKMEVVIDTAVDDNNSNIHAETDLIVTEVVVEEETVEESIMITEVVEEKNTEISSSNSPPATTPVESITTPTTAGNKCLAGGNTLSVSSELAMEQIAKKLNERAARGKESLEEKEKIIKTVNSREISPDLDRSIEEGEIVSSAAATPDPQPAAKSSKAVVIKPKEVVCLPTKLKRNLEDKQPEERKRRVSKKRLCLTPRISVTSDHLKMLLPNAQPTQLEEFEFGNNESDGGEETTTHVENEDDTNIIVSSSTKLESKCVDVEVTVANDVREVKKKKPIVIDSKSPSRGGKSPQGPKLPSQENHKAPRKISIVSADAKALRKSPSPSKKKATEVLYITNLVRPFTVPQLRELLARTGTIAQNGFYIDKIKSKCYVKYTDIEMAIETRHALHGVRWPVNNPKTLRVDFALPEDMAVVQKLADEEAGASKKQDNDAVTTTGAMTGSSANNSGGWLNEQAALKPSRRVTATVREWDMGKVVGGGETGTTKTSPPNVENKKKTDDEWSRKKEKSSRPEKERDRRRAHSPEYKSEPPKKIKKKDVDAPAKLLNDLFRKTKATPCIYWLPLTAAQIAVKEEMRRQHMAEHEKRLAELRKTDTGSRRDNKERERDRDRDRRKK